ncbi:hypothetical protein [Thiohalospira halophila]|uniref:hypothetical protein n=1 Tax=Thiohalospira halophila TaxID=381300 RepID=UPI0011800579|nr:hypothetical protein [Thiohalospira halophila]
MLRQQEDLAEAIIGAAKELAEQGPYQENVLNEVKDQLEGASFPIQYINDIVEEIQENPACVAQNVTTETLRIYLEANHSGETISPFREAIILSALSK